MNLKVHEIYGIIRNINIITEADLPIRVAIKIHKLWKTISNEQESLEELRFKIINKYKDEDESSEDEGIKIREDKFEDYSTDIEEFFNQDIEIDAEKINISDLEDLRISAKDLISLESIIDMEK